MVFIFIRNGTIPEHRVAAMASQAYFQAANQVSGRQIPPDRTTRPKQRTRNRYLRAMAEPFRRDRPPRTREEALREFRTDQILAAARGVIGEIGYAETSVDKIAEAAGVARSTVYVYFDGKDDLVNQCLAQNRVELSERVRSAVEAATGFEAGLHAFLRAILDYVGDYKSFFSAIMQVRGLDPFFQQEDRAAPEADSIRVEVQAILADLLEEGQREGVLDAPSVLEAARVLGSLIYGALMWRANDANPLAAEEEARSLAQTLLYGITRGRSLDR